MITTQQKYENQAIYRKVEKLVQDFYYKNNLKTKKPKELSAIELLGFVEIHNLHAEYHAIIHDITKDIWNIEQRIQGKIPQDVLEILEILQKESQESYLVGGCIRDLALQETPKDWDFVTDIKYGRLKKLFEDCRFKETGTEFLVFNLSYKGLNYEIANFRTDCYNSDNILDHVKIGTLETDIQRRDFTINAMFWNPQGIIITPEALEDIKSRTLRFIGKPVDRLKEHWIRGWRFYRLLGTKNLTPDKNSLKAVRTHFQDVVSKANPQMIMAEVEKLSSISKI